MRTPEPARTPVRVRRTGVRRTRMAGALVALAAVAVALGGLSLSPSSSTATSTVSSLASSLARSLSSRADAPVGRPSQIGDVRGRLGQAGGDVPDGTTVFDGAVPAIANLDPELLGALRRAASAAAADGVRFVVNSGWRSEAYQQRLLRDAIARYGSVEEASRWVAPPDRSAHVSGDAVDLGSQAAAWLSAHGAPYGLCRIYANEAWHFELRPDAAAQGCPAPYADAAHDPRLHP